MRDVARVELGARDYSSNSYLDGKPAVGMGSSSVPVQRPGHCRVRAPDHGQSEQFPEGLEYRLVYDPTVFVQSR